MTSVKKNGTDEFFKPLLKLSPQEKAEYRKIAGHNLGRIRNSFFPNKLSAMAATLQEGKFRQTLNPKDLERQLRRWISNGLPLENIREIARALKIPAAEFLVRTDQWNEDPDECAAEPPGFSQAGLAGVDDRATDGLVRVESKKWTRAKSKIWFGTAAAFIIVLALSIVFFMKRSGEEAIAISWPKIVDTHSEYVSGRLINFNKDSLIQTEVQLFVKPGDGETKYWLNEPPYPPVITKEGIWYQKCRFGDEDIRSMKKLPPLRFDVYAAVLKKGAKRQLTSGKTYLEAGSEVDFMNLLKPYATSVSGKFSLTRVDAAVPEIPIVLGMTPSVKITWGENVPMYIEIYHSGTIVKEGYHNSGESYDLSPSPILYEIKMSRKKGYHQSHTWVLVENDRP